MRNVALLLLLVFITSCNNNAGTLTGTQATADRATGAHNTGVANTPDTAGTDDFPSFWKRFKTAVLNSDTDQIMAMTEFPFETRGPDDDDSTIDYGREKFVSVFRAFLNQWDGSGLEGVTELAHIKNMQPPGKEDVHDDYARMGNLAFNKTRKGWKLVFAYLTYDTIELLNK